MEISPTAPSTLASGSNASLTGLAENFDSFLKLLTEQLRNQDPLAPVDANEFTAQLVQFTGVEQQINTNSKLGELIGLQQLGQAASAVNYLGTTITALGNTTYLENSNASWSYALGENAASVTLTVFDKNNAVIKTVNGNATAGLHDFDWDGVNNQGIAAEDGLYRLQVVAKDVEGNVLDNTTTLFKGHVSGVTTENGIITLLIKDLLVPITDVSSVTEAVTS